MTDQPEAQRPESSNSVTNVSGGVNANTQGGSLNVGDDIVGRDKIVHIEHYHAGGEAAPSKAKVYHNLPHPDYGHFIGREQELKRVHELLSPNSRHFLVTIDGIGGIGKSTLALETAYHYLDGASTLSDSERFDAIIWTSAKQTMLTTEGIVKRKQVLHTLEDIYTSISIVLKHEDITRARPQEQPELVCQALAQQRTLLIVDNLETIDDETLLTFLRELPTPTKAIITTRHRIDVAYPVRLSGMPWSDAQKFIAQECEKKSVALTQTQISRLYDRTGGVPLALVWSIAQMGMGYGIDTVIQRLGQPGGDIARFCFESSIEHIRNTEADELLAIIALFATSASREALSHIGGFDQDVVTRDTALMTLEKLSLVNRMPNGRFGMLPLTKLYVLAASSLDATAIIRFRKRQIEYYLKYIQRPQPFALYPKELVDRIKAEQENILDLLEWCKEHNDQFSLLELFLRIQDLLGVFGRLDLRVAWGEYAIEAAKAVDAFADLGRLYAVTMGWAALKRGELDQASSWIDKGLHIIRESGEQELECVAMRFLGRLKQLEGREEQALQIFLDTLAITEEKRFQGLIAGLNADIAYWKMQHGSLDTAERYMRESIRGFESLGDYVRAADRVIMLADILIRQGKFSDAEECLLPNLEHVEKELGQLEAIAHGYACLAHIQLIRLTWQRLDDVAPMLGKYTTKLA